MTALARCVSRGFAALFATTIAAAPINYTYDAAGRLVVVDYGGGTSLYKIYDPAGNLLERSAPGPLLSATFAPGQIEFSWAALAGDFTLSSTPSLAVPITFTPVPIVPVLSGDRLHVTLTSPPDTAFFLLRK
jgi:YD repeat-containing protein